ncbi:MAG: CBS domain-containing protein [Desulfobacter sp.]|nr:MAG: CBS domain-containing protein [Desulfobacter sp.]
MITAEDIMETNIICINPDTEITRAVEMLLNNHINGVPVVDSHDELLGILCQSDLIFQQKEMPIPPIFTILDGIIPLSSSKKLEDEFQKISASKVKDAMVTRVVTVTPDTPVSEIASLMVEKHFHTLPVVEGKKLVGIIGKEDILKTMIAGPDNDTDGVNEP